MLARYLEHCFYVADQTAFAILNPASRIIVTSLESIPEDSTQDEEDYEQRYSDDDDQQDKDIYLEDVDDAQHGEQSQHHSYGNGKFSTSLMSNIDESNKENVTVLPLRSTYVNNLPVLHFRSFL